MNKEISLASLIKEKEECDKKIERLNNKRINLSSRGEINRDLSNNIRLHLILSDTLSKGIEVAQAQMKMFDNLINNLRTEINKDCMVMTLQGERLRICDFLDKLAEQLEVKE